MPQLHSPVIMLALVATGVGGVVVVGTGLGAGVVVEASKQVTLVINYYFVALTNNVCGYTD